ICIHVGQKWNNMAAHPLSRFAHLKPCRTSPEGNIRSSFPRTPGNANDWYSLNTKVGQNTLDTE
ncbi:hypothetical protein, partial [Portibacter marinus]|uniref:hypothetical protein n=1 Tax=Portibacter marinus TaxID=2898660 RepID=UPI001F2037EB